MVSELDDRRRRARYRAEHRGTREMDWLLGRYVAAKVAALSGPDLERLERLLAMPDPDINAWILAPASIAGSEFAGVVGDLRRFHGLDDDAR